MEYTNRMEKKTCDRILKNYFGIVNKDGKVGQNFYLGASITRNKKVLIWGK